MAVTNIPKHLKEIESKLNEKLKLIRFQPCSELFETQQLYHDEVLEVGVQSKRRKTYLLLSR